MAALLELPRELRDIIVEYVLFSPPCVPDNTARRISRDGWHAPWVHIEHLASKALYQPTALNILLINHQQYHETRELLERTKVGFKLRLAIVDWFHIFPTWYFIPAKSDRCLESLEVDIMFCHGETNPFHYDPDLKDGRINAPNRPISTLYSFCADKINRAIVWLIERFLYYGAAPDFCFGSAERLSLLRISRLTKNHFRAKQLLINIDTTPVDTENAVVPHSVVAGRFISDFPKDNFETLRACSRKSARDWALRFDANRLNSTCHRPDLFAKRFRDVILSVDGEVVKSWGPEDFSTPWVDRLYPEKRTAEVKRLHEKFGLSN